jgi:hypothetical protein
VSFLVFFRSMQQWTDLPARAQLAMKCAAAQPSAAVCEKEMPSAYLVCG